MALARRTGGQISGTIWPGFVDSLTALLLILMFVLSIFMIIQFSLREQLIGQDEKVDVLTGVVAERESEIDDLTGQLSDLATSLGLERTRAATLETEVGTLNSSLTGERAEIARLSSELSAMTAARDSAVADAADVASIRRAAEAEITRMAGELSITQTEAEAARLAAARRDADLAKLRAQNAAALKAFEKLTSEQALALATIAKLEDGRETETGRIARLEAERDRLAAAGRAAGASALKFEVDLKAALDRAAEISARLATADAARNEDLADAEVAARRIASETALRLAAEARLATMQSQTLAQQRKAEALAADVRVMNKRLAQLQALLGEADKRDGLAKVRLAELGSKLNEALAQRVSELSRFRSDFFGRMREILGERAGVEIVGDRFVFQSEVLFRSGKADLGAAGKAELAKLAVVIRELSETAPEDLDWVLRVDGHTDKIPVGRRERRFRDNWELSQARALSVVRFLIDSEQIPGKRLAATGFGEFQPIYDGDDLAEMAVNRRIEFKFTER